MSRIYVSYEEQFTTSTVADQTAALIDHVLTNLSDKVRQSGVVYLGMSNHSLI